MSATAIYYAFIASPGFASEVRFVVRSSAPLLSRDRYAGSDVEPKEKIVQDTAVLLNYIGSPAIIQDLDKSLSLRRIFGRSDIDFVSRLPNDATQDELLEYWKKHYTASVNPKSGIVELEVKAYTSKEAHLLVGAVLRLAEAQINNLSSGMWDDLLISTQRDVDSATTEVSALRSKIKEEQNRTGVFDIDLSAESITSVLTGLEASIADLRSRRAALVKSVRVDTPQVAEMDRRLAGLEEQARGLRDRAAGSMNDPSDSLATYSGVFDSLKLDLKMAEGRLESAISDLEKIKLVKSLQLVYIDNFTEPTVPDEAKYPKVVLGMFLNLLCFVGVWGVASGLLLLARKKLD
ncbi:MULTISPECIES: hypothetical protein [unclassified Ensifer]|uniref:hypothetical protein n=1 Tax=unclassified Ensifer TaxID=2633371 RepID=UPI00300F9FA5